MRLLLSSHGANLYGAERVLVALAGGLAARGHGVVLEIPHRGPVDAAVSALAGVEVVYSGRPKPPRGTVRAVRYAASVPGTVAALRRLIRTREVDVVWVNSLVNPLAAAAARLEGVPSVWHLHECAFGGAAGRVAERVVAAADLPLAVSAYVASTFPSLAGRIRVLPNALLADIRPAPPRHGTQEPLTVGYVGQLKARKRADELLRALAAVPGARAVVAGDGPDRPMLERLAVELGVDGRLSMRGFIPDVRDFYAGVDCVVIPSVDEPFGLVALEALASGRPVVAARSGALPEVLGDAALFYPPGDTGALGAHLAGLAVDAALRASLRERGLRRVAAFGVDGWLDGAEAAARLAVERRGGRSA